MYCNIVDNKIVNPSTFEGDREFELNYFSYINAPENYFVYDEETDDIIVNPDFAQEEKQQRIAEFNREFFNTSLGYIRRKVTMANGDTKDFLSDLLPTITIAVNMGQEVRVLAYDMPDFEDLKPIEEYQHSEIVTAQFIQECFLQLSNDFIQS